MKKVTEIGNRELKEIDFMIFRIMGVVLGIDIEQISQIREPDHVWAKNVNIFAFHQKIPFRGKKVLYKSPKILFIKDKWPASGIIIDQPEEIIRIKTGSIQPLPLLIKRFNRSTPIWGAVPKGEEIVLLIDLCRLLKSKTCTEAEKEGGSDED